MAYMVWPWHGMQSPSSSLELFCVTDKQRPLQSANKHPATQLTVSRSNPLGQYPHVVPSPLCCHRTEPGGEFFWKMALTLYY